MLDRSALVIREMGDDITASRGSGDSEARAILDFKFGKWLMLYGNELITFYGLQDKAACL